MAGQGVVARVDDRGLHVGGPALLRKRCVDLPSDLQDAADESEDRGQTTVFLVEDGRVLAVFGLADRVREESFEAVDIGIAIGAVIVALNAQLLRRTKLGGSTETAGATGRRG